MIPVECLWIALIVVFGLVGSARGLRKELGASAILLLSLFAFHMLETLILNRFTAANEALEGWPTGTLSAIYYTVLIIFVAFISYEGVVLQFPVKELTGVGKGLVGFWGGLLNGYLIIGTVWNVLARADYLRPKIGLVSGTLSDLHNGIVELLPVSIMNTISPYIMLVLGMILLLAIVLK